MALEDRITEDVVEITYTKSGKQVKVPMECVAGLYVDGKFYDGPIEVYQPRNNPRFVKVDLPRTTLGGIRLTTAQEGKYCVYVSNVTGVCYKDSTA